MSFALIRAIRSQDDHPDMRLIMPFGLHLAPGDVVSRDREGTLMLQGNVASILPGAPPVTPTQPGPALNLEARSERSVEVKFRAGGETSSLFPDMPKASARLDVTFSASNAWFLSVIGRRISSMAVGAYQRWILEAYDRGVWDPGWGLISQVGVADKLTLLASKEANTQVTLSANATISGTGPSAVLSAGVSILAANKSMTQCIFDSPAATFCTMMGVKTGWFKDPSVGVLEGMAATDEEFFEDMDKMAEAMRRPTQG